jgi:hypothetical protein
MPQSIFDSQAEPRTTSTAPLQYSPKKQHSNKVSNVVGQDSRAYAHPLPVLWVSISILVPFPRILLPPILVPFHGSSPSHPADSNSPLLAVPPRTVPKTPIYPFPETNLLNIPYHPPAKSPGSIAAPQNPSDDHTSSHTTLAITMTPPSARLIPSKSGKERRSVFISVARPPHRHAGSPQFVVKFPQRVTLHTKVSKPAVKNTERLTYCPRRVVCI